MKVNGDPKEIDLTDFDTILEFVHNDFKKKLNKEEMEKTVAKTVKLGNNFGVKIIPLFLKNHYSLT